MFPSTVSTINRRMKKAMKKNPMIKKPMFSRSNCLQRMAYTTNSVTTDMLLNSFFNKIESTSQQDPNQWLIIASHYYSDPKPLVNEIYLHGLSVMDLLNQFAYPSLTGYAKVSILITVLRSYGEEITITIGKAIPLTDQSNQLLPKSVVYSLIIQLFLKYSEVYDGDSLVRVMIRVYMEQDKKKEWPVLSEEDRYNSLSSIIQEGVIETESLTDLTVVRGIRHSNRIHKSQMPKQKQSKTELKPFIVSDLETILIDNVHKPYAAGLLLVRPGEEIKDLMINTYFSEDYSIIIDSFEDRSTKVLYDLVLRIAALVKEDKSVKTIYFHNFSRFDGIILLKHLVCHHPKYKLKPLMRNNRLYELAVLSGRKIVFRFRDSLNLLPGKLSDLAKNLCPVLGPKGSIKYEEVNLSNLVSMQKVLVDYMKQDIYLLGGVMQKAQDIYCKLYKLDIESKITLSSLALSIFRQRYYDADNWPIHIPNRNEDTFIRRAYYGGHTDAYKPYGENLYYYDVNSLYPFVMKEYPMPGGEPVWHRNLEDKELDSILGFIEAYVVCPKTIKKPFLPYRDKNETLIFPTGEFVGVYYSEELKFARDLGYTVIPLSGYLFEKKESPFKEFVSAIFRSRLDAKKSGNDALSYVYKILMNSLYGRFGINPKSTVTEVCDSEKYKKLIRNTDFIFSDKLTDNCYIVSYHSNTDTDHWSPPKNSAVQLAAAITAYARIYMYPYISREDCYYTDTDSVVLGQPLPEELISSSVLGLFKLEDRISKGYFLAPKSYYYKNEKGNEILKYKGAAKTQISPEWFQSQYADPSRKQQVLVEANFRIQWSTLNIFKKDKLIKIGINLGSKRKPVCHGEVWVDTEPIEVKDLSRVDHIGKRIVQLLRAEVIHLKDENLFLHEKLLKKEKEIAEKKNGIAERDKEMKEESTEVTNPTVNEIPNTDENQPTEVTSPTVDEIPNTEKKKPP